MSFSLQEILFLVVIFQLVFTSLFLVTHRRGRRISNTLLALFFLAIALDLIDNLLLIKGAYFSHPGLGLWSVWLLLLFGPLLYLYTQSILYRGFRIAPKRMIHFLPFLMLFLITEVYWQIQPSAAKQAFLHNITTQRTTTSQYWTGILIFVQFFAYIAAAFALIGRFNKVARDEFSNPQRTDIRWLSYTLIFFSITMLLAALNSVIRLTWLAAYWWPLFLIVIFLVFVYINSVLLKALQNPQLFAVLEEGPSAPAPAPEPSQQPGERGQPGLPAGRQTALDQVLRYMATNRPWLEPDLTLDQLAAMLQLKPKQLSQLINQGAGKSFFEFINSYRIGEAQRLLTDPADKKITVLEVLYQVGFNSKSSFNTLFKKQTGLTPSEFKKKNSN